MAFEKLAGKTVHARDESMGNSGEFKANTDYLINFSFSYGNLKHYFNKVWKRMNDRAWCSFHGEQTKGTLHASTKPTCLFDGGQKQ